MLILFKFFSYLSFLTTDHHLNQAKAYALELVEGILKSLFITLMFSNKFPVLFKWVTFAAII